MYSDLHTLKLVLPGMPQHTAGVGSTSQAYLWPCDCLASGTDENALQVRCCAFHSELLAAATSPRGAMDTGD